MERSGNDFSKILFEYFSTVDEVTGDSIEEDNQIIQNLDIKNDIYDCPHCGQVFSNFAEVEGHITTEHEDITRQIVRCSECKKVLPNDEKVIKHHMINEHIKPKQKSVATPKNDHLTKPNNRYQISLNMSLRHEGAENITLGSQVSDLCF